MATPLQSLRLPLGHPLVEKLCELSLNNKAAFNEKSKVNFKEEVSKEDRTKFEQVLRVLHAIVNNETSLKYLSDDNQKFMEDLAQDKKITNEKIEKTLEIVSTSDVDVDFEKFKELMLEVDFVAVGLKSYSQSQLLDLNGGHWDLEVPSAPKESVTFRFDNLPKDPNGKEENFYYKQKKEVKRELKDLQRDKEFWTKSSQSKVSVPVGWDINHKEVCFEIGNAQNHTLICGCSGSGKSNFLHVLIQNLAFYYAPNEVQLFLLDYKEGVEFNAYVADPALEHARLVSVASSVSYGITFLKWLCDEMQKRAELFKQFKVKDLSDYRKHEKMPRLIVVIDEFQVLFSDNKSTKAVEGHLNTLLKKGRSYGVHLVLATQTMRGTEINPSFKAQIANRIALPMDAEDSSSVLGDDAACELVRPEGIFNNNGGHQKYHTKMSIPKAPDDFTAFSKKSMKNLTKEISPP